MKFQWCGGSLSVDTLGTTPTYRDCILMTPTWRNFINTPVKANEAVAGRGSPSPLDTKSPAPPHFLSLSCTSPSKKVVRGQLVLYFISLPEGTLVVFITPSSLLVGTLGTLSTAHGTHRYRELPSRPKAPLQLDWGDLALVPQVSEWHLVLSHPGSKTSWMYEGRTSGANILHWNPFEESRRRNDAPSRVGAHSARHLCVLTRISTGNCFHYPRREALFGQRFPPYWVSASLACSQCICAMHAQGIDCVNAAVPLKQTGRRERWQLTRPCFVWQNRYFGDVCRIRAQHHFGFVWCKFYAQRMNRECMYVTNTLCWAQW